MILPGFVGPTYVSRSPGADCERTINLYPEVIESGKGKNGIVLYGTPGLKPFAQLPAGPVRALYSGDGERVFAVSGAVLYEVFSGGTYRALGGVGDYSGPAVILANGHQLLVQSGSKAYLADGINVRPVTDAAMATFLDGYFIALEPASQRFRISGLYDGDSWDALDFGSASAAPDHAVSILAAHGELWVFGQRTTEVFRNTGNPDFPFERIGSGYIEQGCVARWSPARLDNSIFWLGGDDRGAGVLWKASGYLPDRVSTHAVESAWSRYGRIDDAIGFSYVDQGHGYYVLWFPSADVTWVYDVTTGMWHERSWWDAVHGRHAAWRGMSHCHAWSKHLIGDRLTGHVYELRHDYYLDGNGPIRRERVTPHVFYEGEELFYHLFRLDMEVGAGGGSDGEPRAMLQFSRDGGRTWSNERWASAGRIGEYSRRVIWRRLGRARDMVFRVAISDDIPVALINAHIEVTKGTR